MEWLEHAAQLTIVLSFVGGICGAIFNYVLGESVNELRIDLKSNNARLNKLEGAIERIEKAVVTAHARIDKVLHGGGEHNEHHDMGHG